jgi:hypothetical protein
MNLNEPCTEHNQNPDGEEIIYAEHKFECELCMREVSE